jgi:hypothetical protein
MRSWGLRLLQGLWGSTLQLQQQAGQQQQVGLHGPVGLSCQARGPLVQQQQQQQQGLVATMGCRVLVGLTAGLVRGVRQRVLSLSPSTCEVYW